jgi:hypothetical protein
MALNAVNAVTSRSVISGSTTFFASAGTTTFTGWSPAASCSAAM